MKEPLNRIIQTSTAIFLTWVVVYGIVYAQQMCCSTIVGACIPPSNIISASYINANSLTALPSHQQNRQLRSNLCPKNITADFGSGNKCCETNQCVSHNQTTYLNISFIPDVFPLQKGARVFDAGVGGRPAVESCSPSISPTAVPIYILTQSIIC